MRTYFSGGACLAAKICSVAFLILSIWGCGGSLSSQIDCLDEVACIHPLDIPQLKSNTEAIISRVNFVEQIDQTGCGAAVLSSVMAYWGISKSYDYIISKYPQRSELGYTLGELKQIASQQGLLSFSLIMNETNLIKQLEKGRPIIVPVKVFLSKFYEYLPNFTPFLGALKFSHYLVIFGFDNAGYWIMNPASGYSYLERDEFLKMWKEHKNAGLLISEKAK